MTRVVGARVEDRRSAEVDGAVRAWLAEYGAETADVGHLLCDRHHPDGVAFVHVDSDLSSTILTYGELADSSRRLATVLAARGVTTGTCVPVLMGKRRELVITLLALWRLGAVHVPLFTAFAAGAIRLRVEGAEAGLVVTEPSQRSKLDEIDGITILAFDEELESLIAVTEPLTDRHPVGGDGTMMLLFTSGTTGKPKGVAVPVRALAAFHAYMRFGLDVSEEDVFWNAADPGWAYGLYYGVVGPLLIGRPNLLLATGFTPESTVAVMRRFGVTNFAGAPTMYRALSKSGVVRGVSLRRASSAGEPLTPDVVAWARTGLDTEIRDHYGQTELGMVINNHWHDSLARPVRPGSMGSPMPGYTAGIVDGQIAVEVATSPLLWFTGYHRSERSLERFSSDGSWYLTADTGYVDDEGYFYFTARDDDVILAAGYRIGPFEVEGVLSGHPDVAEVAVVGRSDPEGIRGEVVEAFVVLVAGIEPTAALAEELQQVVRDQYSKHAYPRTVHFVGSLPRTPSGKVQRFKLREQGTDEP